MSNGAANKQVLQPYIIRIVKIRHKSFRSASDSIRIFPLNFDCARDPRGVGVVKVSRTIACRVYEHWFILGTLGFLFGFFILFFFCGYKQKSSWFLPLPPSSFNILLAHGPENPEGSAAIIVQADRFTVFRYDIGIIIL